ncbi:type II toxin-antitoxin system PemK/MazF family toxin [Methanolacinia petrolearia]|uniref:type II toxin-antitoxin system PemK/MazF family toxin n=1 Tax=Methanolacinia petrolearia TaxID=54120 RepID=UPI003BAD9F40
MEQFVKGDVLVVPFPFSDLSGTKRRPVFVAAVLNGDDLILCQITSRNRNDNYSVPLSDSDFVEGAIKVKSVIRPNRIFTAEKSIILYRIGKVNPAKAGEVEEVLVRIFKVVA